MITQLICHFTLTIPRIAAEYQIDFQSYFAQEWEQLKQLQADGLLAYDDERIDILPAGRLLVRNICMIFDIYLRQNQPQRFSKVI